MDDDPYKVPTLKEINVYDTLDERVAAQHFFGKDLKQAEELFRENFLYYQETLLFMGPQAFCYYVQAAIAYLMSVDANGDSDAVSCFCMVVEFQLEHYGDSIYPVRARLREAVQAILDGFPRFDCDPNVGGDLESRFLALRHRLTG